MAFKKEIIDIIEPRDVFVGNKNAPITLEEFGEYESEVCAKANEWVKKILDEYKEVVRFSFRHFPLTHKHQRSLKASEAAVASAQEGKFWEMHNVLFANRRNLGTTSLKLYSKEAGITNKKFLDDLMNATFGWQVQGDIKEGKDRGVTDAPTFFVNGKRVSQADYDSVKELIESTLENLNNPKKSAPKSQTKSIPKTSAQHNDAVASIKKVVKPAEKSKPVVDASTKTKVSAKKPEAVEKKSTTTATKQAPTKPRALKKPSK